MRDPFDPRPDPAPGPGEPVMGLPKNPRRARRTEDHGRRVDTTFGRAFDAVLADSGVRIVKSGVQIPRMNSVMERWIQTCRRELLDRILIWNRRHLLHALREFESFYNGHRPQRAMIQAAPLRPLPGPITEPAQIRYLDIHRRDGLNGILHEYQHARLTKPDD
jgi:putative transposase